MTMFTASMHFGAHEPSLADLRRFYDLTDGFPDETELEVREDGVYLNWVEGGIPEWEKQLITEKQKTSPPRDHLGRFTKRPHYSDVLLD